MEGVENEMQMVDSRATYAAHVVMLASGLVVGLGAGILSTGERYSPMTREFFAAAVETTPLAIVVAALVWSGAAKRRRDAPKRLLAVMFVGGFVLSLACFLLLGEEWLVGRNLNHCLEGRAAACASLSSRISRRGAPSHALLRDALYCRECAVAPGSVFCVRLVSQGVCVPHSWSAP